MADVNANIGVNIDTSAALAQLKDLQRQISQFHSSIAKSSQAAALAQRDLQRNFLNSVNALGAFSAELRTVKTTSESFTNSLEKNKFSMREYFRYAGASTKTFGKLFKSEYDTIGKVAEDRVKKLQTQYIKMGRDASGAMKAIAIIPNELDMGNFATQTQIASQKQALFNQLMRQGSTNLLNFGKNTQWAGRQLMVGFTLPLMAVGAAASKSFMQMEAQALKFRKVYGDLFTPQAETQQALADVQELAKQFTKYGIAVADTVGLAADAAAAGFKGIDLQRQTTEATRLSVLGQIDNQQALETTIALQNAFNISSEELAQNIDFLNAVENQTVVSLDDITTAIPKVAPVIQQLGGDVKDLAFFLTAMKEGGINASEGANALKSGLAALINPSSRARDMLQGLGIDINGIVNNNKGDLKATVVGFAQALDTLAPLDRARAIEQMFGKFQFARLSTLFQNVTKDGTQAARVLDLAGASVSDLASLSNQELGKTADSAMNKFKKSVEDLKAAIVPVGEAFLKTVTPIVDFIATIAEKFSNLSDGTKKAITVMVTVIGGLGPILLMTFGLLANGVANIIKLFLTLRTGYQRLTGQSQNLGEQTQYMTSEQIDAAAAAHSLNQAHATLTQQFTVEAEALQRLIAAYIEATSAAARFAMTNPGMMVPPRVRGKFANSGIIRGPGGPKDDKVHVMASNGEAILSAETVNANKEAVDALIQTGKFIPKTDLTGTSGNNARSGFSYSGVNRLMRGEGLPGATVGVPASNVNSLIADGLKKITDEKVQFAHVTDKVVITLDQLVASLDQLPEAVKKAKSEMIAKVKELQMSFGGQTPVNVYSGLGFSQSAELNNAMQKDRPVAAQSFLDDFTKRGTEKWQTSLEIGGTTLDSVNAELKAYDDAIASGIQKMLDLDENTTITSSQFAKLEKEVRALLPEGSQLKLALDSAETTLTEWRLNLTKGMAESSGMSTFKKPSSTNPGQMSPKPWVKLPSGKEFRLGGDHDVRRLPSGLGPMPSEVVDNMIAATKKEAKVQSPSKRTIPIGEDIARGLEVGMQNRKDDISRVGKALSDTAVSSTRVRRVASRPAGAPGVDNMVDASTRERRSASRPQGPSNVSTTVLLSKIEADMLAERKKAADAAQAQIRAMRAQEAEQQRLINVAKQEEAARQASISKMGKMNSALQSGSFALMSLSGMAQMFGGTLGNISNVIFNVSGALFALQTVTQLLTQAKLLEVVATKANTVAQAMGAGSFRGLFAGLTGFIPKLKAFGGFLLQALKMMPGWGKLAAVLVTVGVGLWQYKKAQDAAKRETEALATAMAITTDQVKVLGDFFSIVPRKLAIDIGPTKDVVGTKTRSAREELKASSGFQKEFGGTIKTLAKATDQEAQLALTGIAMKLKAQGFATEQIQVIIDSLREEAGKTSIVLDVKSIDFSPKGIADLKKKTKSEFASLARAGKKSYDTVWEMDRKTGLYVKKMVPVGEFKKAFATLAGFISTTAISAGTMFKNGEISAVQYQDSIMAILGNMEGLDRVQRRILMINLFKKLGVNAAPFLKSLQNTKQEMQVIALLSAGIIDKESNILKNLASNDAEAQRRGRYALAMEAKKLAVVEEIVKAENARNDVVSKTTGPSADTLSKEAKLTIARLQKELDGLKTKRDVINETNTELKRQYDYQQKLMQLSKDSVQAKISGDYIGANILEQQKSFETGQFNKETDSLALDKKIMTLENRISELQANARVTAAETALNKARKKGGMAMGGLIKGPGTGTSDSILAKVGYAKGGFIGVSNNEYIVKAASVQKYGVGFMDAVNNQQLSPVSTSSSSSEGGTVYNIDMVINGGDAVTIADQVIRRLKIETSKNNKTNMVKY